MTSHDERRSRRRVRAPQRRSADRAILDGLPDLVVHMVASGEILAVHAPPEWVLPHRADRFAGLPLTSLLPDEVAERIVAAAGAALASGSVATVEYSVAGGNGDAHFEARLVPTEGGEIVALVRDITQQWLAEAKLERAEARFRAFSESAHDLVLVVDEEGAVRYASPSSEPMLGHGPAEIEGRPLEALAHPEDRDRVRDLLEHVLAEPRAASSYEIRLRHGDGTYRSVDGTARNLLDVDAVGGIVTNSRDITEQVEVRRLREAHSTELERSNRELQDFAYVASHDLQEPLRKIQAFGDRLKTRYADALDETGRDYLERMHAAATRMQRLIRDLLAFSRVATTVQPFVRVDLEGVAREVVHDLQAQVERTGGTVVVEPLPAVEADPLQMRQLLQNLVGNALKFHPEGVAPVVRVSARLRGDTVEVSVADRGIGFDQKYADRVFAPFERLHGRSGYEGTGMGLAICRRIAQRHGGDVTAVSVAGEGTTFVVTLPHHHGEGGHA